MKSVSVILGVLSFTLCAGAYFVKQGAGFPRIHLLHIMRSTPQASASVPAATLTNPKKHGRITCSRGSEGLFRCSVSGTMQDLTEAGRVLLLWVKPVQPSGDGWYLQRGNINGIHTVEEKGKWEGVAQLGNVQYPPHEKDKVEVAITIVTTEEARKLFSAEGVVVRGGPVGTIADKAVDVSVHLQ